MRDPRLDMRLEDVVRKARGFGFTVEEQRIVADTYKANEIKYISENPLPKNSLEVYSYLLEKNRFCYEPSELFIRAHIDELNKHRYKHQADGTSK